MCKAFIDGDISHFGKVVSCQNLNRVGTNWMVCRLNADLETHNAVVLLNGVEAFGNITRLSNSLPARMRDYISQRNIELGTTVKDCILNCARYHEPGVTEVR